MGSNSRIEWTDATWNPVRGCSMAKGSEAGGCLNCYAARMAARGLPGLNSPTTGEPFAVMRDSGPRWTGKVELIESALELPLHWRKPRRIFVNSMSDLFHESLSAYDISRVFAVMRFANRHTYMILTKRAPRMLSLLGSAPWWAGTEPDVWKHVWLGVSVEERWNKGRIELLRETPAALRFLSLEPLLEDLGDLDLTGIGWVIVGAESGPGAWPMDEKWVRSIRDQCVDTDVPFFYKQRLENGHKVSLPLLDGQQWAQFPEAPHAK